MNESFKRRLTAISALVLGLFIGLALLPVSWTGPLGSGLGVSLWRFLGLGAVGLPLLGLGMALAGFERLPRVDMRKVAGLAAGLILLVPFFISILTGTTSNRPLVGPLSEWSMAARMSGIVPGFLASALAGKVGFAGALLIGFLALSALTLWAIGWHPLQRLERGAKKESGEPAGKVLPQVGTTATDVVVSAPEPPTKPKKRPKKKLRRLDQALAQAALDDTALPPIELLEPPRKTIQ